MADLQEVGELLKTHAQLIRKFTAQIKATEIAKSGTAPVVEIVKHLNENIVLLGEKHEGPEMDEMKNAMKQLVRQGLLLVKADKSPEDDDASPEGNAYIQQMQIWKTHFLALKNILISNDLPVSSPSRSIQNRIKNRESPCRSAPTSLGQLPAFSAPSPHSPLSSRDYLPRSSRSGQDTHGQNSVPSTSPLSSRDPLPLSSRGGQDTHGQNSVPSTSPLSSRDPLPLSSRGGTDTLGKNSTPSPSALSSRDYLPRSSRGGTDTQGKNSTPSPSALSSRDPLPLSSRGGTDTLGKNSTPSPSALSSRDPLPLSSRGGTDTLGKNSTPSPSALSSRDPLPFSSRGGPDTQGKNSTPSPSALSSRDPLPLSSRGGTDTYGQNSTPSPSPLPVSSRGRRDTYGPNSTPSPSPLSSRDPLSLSSRGGPDINGQNSTQSPSPLSSGGGTDIYGQNSTPSPSALSSRDPQPLSSRGGTDTHGQNSTPSPFKDKPHKNSTPEIISVLAKSPRPTTNNQGSHEHSPTTSIISPHQATSPRRSVSSHIMAVSPRASQRNSHVVTVSPRASFSKTRVSGNQDRLSASPVSRSYSSSESLDIPLGETLSFESSVETPTAVQPLMGRPPSRSLRSTVRPAGMVPPSRLQGRLQSRVQTPPKVEPVQVTPNLDELEDLVNVGFNDLKEKSVLPESTSPNLQHEFLDQMEVRRLEEQEDLEDSPGLDEEDDIGTESPDKPISGKPIYGNSHSVPASPDTTTKKRAWPPKQFSPSKEKSPKSKKSRDAKKNLQRTARTTSLPREKIKSVTLSNSLPLLDDNWDPVRPVPRAASQLVSRDEHDSYFSRENEKYPKIPEIPKTGLPRSPSREDAARNLMKKSVKKSISSLPVTLQPLDEIPDSSKTGSKKGNPSIFSVVETPPPEFENPAEVEKTPSPAERERPSRRITKKASGKLGSEEKLGETPKNRLTKKIGTSKEDLAPVMENFAPRNSTRKSNPIGVPNSSGKPNSSGVRRFSNRVGIPEREENSGDTMDSLQDELRRLKSRMAKLDPLHAAIIGELAPEIGEFGNSPEISDLHESELALLEALDTPLHPPVEGENVIELEERLRMLQMKMASENLFPDYSGISGIQESEFPNEEDDVSKVLQTMVHRRMSEPPKPLDNYSGFSGYPEVQPSGADLLRAFEINDGDDVETLRLKLAEIKRLSQVADINSGGISILQEAESGNESEFGMFREFRNRDDENYDPLGEDWNSDPLFQEIFNRETDGYDTVNTMESSPHPGVLESDLALLGIESMSDLANMSVEDLEQRLALLEQEWENNELEDELQRLAREPPQTRLSLEELGELLNMGDGDEVDVNVNEEEVINAMNNLKKTDADAQLLVIEQLAQFAQSDGKSIDFMEKEGLTGMFPTFFKTKGPQFLIHVCNIIASIPLKSALRSSLTTSQMISFLMETYKTPNIPLSKASEDALIKLSQKNGNLPLILQLLTSEVKNVQEKAKHKLKQTCVMFSIASTTPSSLSTPTTTSPIEFVEKLGAGYLSPAILLGLTDEQLMMFMPLVMKDTQNSKPLVKFIMNWAAFLHRVQLSPLVGPHFYWLGLRDGIFKSGKTEGDISVFCLTKELEDTQIFFGRFIMYWDKLGSGYSRKNLNLVDPLSSRKVKTVEVTEQPEVPADQTRQQSPLQRPLVLTLGLHGDEKVKICLRKGIDIRAGGVYLQTILNVLNSIWGNSKIAPKPELRTYQIVPIAKDLGCSEILEPSTAVKTCDWSFLYQATEPVKMKVAGSLAGAIVASWVLGFRDKLEEYMFLHENQVFFSSVDVQHMWNSRPLDIDFINKLKPHMTAFNGSYGWSFFQNLCGEAFRVLHEKGPLILHLCLTLYGDIYDKEALEDFLKGNKALMVGVPLQEAQSQFMTSLNDTGTLRSKLMNKMFKHKK